VTLSSIKKSGDGRRFPALGPPLGANLVCLSDFPGTVHCVGMPFTPSFSLTSVSEAARRKERDGGAAHQGKRDPTERARQLAVHEISHEVATP
jgi:hypothetical protein